MFYRRSAVIFFLLCSCIANTMVFSQTFNSFNEFNQFIYDTVAQTLPKQAGEELGINPVQLDIQRRLPSCQSALITSVARPGLSAPSNSVLLKCPDPVPWEMYVPVHITLMTDMLSASQRILPGEILTENNVVLQKGDKYQMQGDYFNDMNQITGLVASRMIQEGDFLSKRNLKKAVLIKKNQTIHLILKHGAIEISMSGIAQSDGYLNDSIKVINPSSKKTVDAQVVAQGSAQIEY